MIKLTRLNGMNYYLNADLIEQIESTPDTVVTLSINKTLLVKETPEEVIEKVIDYKRKIFGFDKEFIKFIKDA